MKTLNTLVNANTRTNARTLTNFLKAKGLPAKQPRTKNVNGLWEVDLVIKKGTLGKKRFNVVNGVAVAA